MSNYITSDIISKTQSLASLCERVNQLEYKIKEACDTLNFNTSGTIEENTDSLIKVAKAKGKVETVLDTNEIVDTPDGNSLVDAITDLVSVLGIRPLGDTYSENINKITKKIKEMKEKLAKVKNAVS